MLFCSCVFSPLSISITLIGEERANLSTFIRLFVCACLVHRPFGVWEGLRFVIGALLDFSLTFFHILERRLAVFKSCFPLLWIGPCDWCVLSAIVITSFGTHLPLSF